MANERADPFKDTDIDFSDFVTKPAERPRASAEHIAEVSEKHNFRSREAHQAPPRKTARPARSHSPVEHPHEPADGHGSTGSHSPSPREGRRRRVTHRNLQMNLKLTADFKRRFDALADRLAGGRLVEAFEMAVEALEAANPELGRR